MKWKEPISVIIPFYNEKDRVAETFMIVDSFLKAKFETYEIIPVDDGSDDITQDNICNFIMACNYQNIKPLFYITNYGKGHAIRRGLLNAKHNLIMILDADLSVQPINILKFMDRNSKRLTKPILCLGQRNQIVKQGQVRLFLGDVFRWLVSKIIEKPIKDTQCPYKILYNIDKELIKNMVIDGFAYDVELIRIAEINKIKIFTQNVPYFNDENSSVTLPKIIRMAYDLIRIKIKY